MSTKNRKHRQVEFDFADEARLSPRNQKKKIGKNKRSFINEVRETEAEDDQLTFGFYDNDSSI